MAPLLILNGPLAHDFGCKQGCALQKIYRDKVLEKPSIPTLFNDHDISDPKVVSVDQIKDRFRQYLAMIEQSGRSCSSGTP